MPSHHQSLTLHSRVHRPFKAQPFTTGLPWPKGAIANADSLRLRDEGGDAMPAAFTVLNRWDDGSVQWTLVDGSADFAPSGDQHLAIDNAGGDQPSPPHAVIAEKSTDAVTVRNGLTTLTVSAVPGELIRRWDCHGKPFVRGDGVDLTFKAAAGKTYSLKAGARTVTIEHANPLRAVIRLDGKHADGDGRAWLSYYMRFELHAGRPDVKITYAFRNTEEPTPGIVMRDVQFRLPTAVGAGAERCFTASNRTRHYLNMFMRVPEDPMIVASDTADLANYEKEHTEKSHGDVYMQNAEVLRDPHESKPWWLHDQKFRKQAGGEKCVWPYLAIVGKADGKNAGAIATIGKMSTLHPATLTVEGSTFVFGLWPAWAGDLKVTQGAGRSKQILIAPVAADASDIDLQNIYLSWESGGAHTHVPSQDTIAIGHDLDHIRESKVFAMDMLPAYDPDKRFLFERKVLDAWIGVSYGQLGAMDQVAAHKCAGFWDYGDDGRGNNEEMAHLVYFQNYLRTGNHGCFEKAMAGTQHMMEVDHCAYSVDSFQAGGQVAHCMNHNDGTAYPSHMWFTEYLFAYALTGDIEFKKTAMRTCDSLLNWIDDSEGWEIIKADQREAGQPMINLTWVYEFNRDQRYLDGCRKIIYEYLMANSNELGRMLDKIPMTMPVKVASYGDYASWEGMFWYWRITQDDTVKAFMLKEFEWRITEACSGVHGFHRSTDYNPAAYAYYLTGDTSWFDRIKRPLVASFKAARWPIGWVHAMYALKIAFDEGIIEDDDVTVC